MISLLIPALCLLKVATASLDPSPPPPLRVAYQGEPGAYSEKSLRSLLGPSPTSVAHKSFSQCYASVTTRDCDYALLPFENSLGGSIHENYDLLLRYDLKVVAEHDFRVSHCMITRPGVPESDIKFAISHPQALKQCSEWLRSRGIEPIDAYDTAGSVKNLASGTDLPKGCTPENTCAIASDLAAETYGCEVRHSSIEDDDSNFTRFLLLSRRGVTKTDCEGVKCKTSVVFTLEETPGALYKALACFSLRDVDFSKIESRPTSPGLLSHLKFKGKRGTGRFRYCFYLDFLSHAEDVKAKNALSHLSECTSFSKVLGSYPSGSGLVGHVSNDLRTRAPAGDGRGKTDFIDGARAAGAVEGGAVVGKNCEGMKHFSKEEVNAKALRKFGTVMVSSAASELEGHLSSLPSMKGRLLLVDSELLVMGRDTANRMRSDAWVVPVHLVRDGGGRGTVMYDDTGVGGGADDLARWLEVMRDCRWNTVRVGAEEHDERVGGARLCSVLLGALGCKAGVGGRAQARGGEEGTVLNMREVAEEADRMSFDDVFELYRHTPGGAKVLRKLRAELDEVEARIRQKESYVEAREEMETLDRVRVLEEVKRMIREENMNVSLENTEGKEEKKVKEKK